MKRVCQALGLGLIGIGLSACPQQPAPVSPLATPTPVSAQTATPTPISTHAATPATTPLATPSPMPTALPEAFVPRRSYDTSKLFNGLKIYSHLQSLPGGIAPVERTLDDSFSVDISLKVKVPAPMAKLEDFTIANPNITKALPMLGNLLTNSRVSPFYHYLYAQKVKSLQQDMRTLDEILSRHNFFDCGTVLEMINPATKRKALLMQADMDVVADGSDSDRYLEVDGSSMHYQPFTSYRWPKLTTTPSQFLASKQAAILVAQTELTKASNPAITAERAKTLRNFIAGSQLDIADLQTFSFLISKADPFIVLPGYMLHNQALPFCPRVGDYVAVIYRDKIYPAIFGDVGPNVKVGEASLRIATTLNSKANANIRATNDLDVSYLIFPQTADATPAPPDYEKWRTRCVELLTELGAANVTVEHWDNILPPMPTPTPPPTPTPSPAPAIPAPKALETETHP